MFKKNHCCYIIRSGEHVKIGYTSNLKKRLDSLQTGNQHELELLHVYTYRKSLFAAMQEQMLHRKFDRHRVRGEWFDTKPVQRYLFRQKLFRQFTWCVLLAALILLGVNYGK